METQEPCEDTPEVSSSLLDEESSGTHSSQTSEFEDKPDEPRAVTSPESSGNHSQQENSAKSSIRFIHPAGTSKRKTLALGWEDDASHNASCANLLVKFERMLYLHLSHIDCDRCHEELVKFGEELREIINK